MNTEPCTTTTPDAPAEKSAKLNKGWNHKDLTPDQILGLRYSRAVAYRNGHYSMQPPPVCTTRWNDEAWQNWVKFNDETLTGFLPYTENH